MPNQGSQSHHLRNYLFLITLVIGGIFIILLVNDDQLGLSITSAVIENAKNRSLGEVINNKNLLTGGSVAKENVLKNTPSFNFILSSDTIPAIDQQVSIEQLYLKSLDLAAKIKVNGDKLELNNIGEINLNFAGFSGRLGFDEAFFSIDGKAKRLEINGIALSSDREISLSFEDLEYQLASFEGIELDIVQFIGGSGELKVGDHLNYRLEEDQSITLYNYLGGLDLNNGGGNSTKIGSLFAGASEGLDIISESLDLNLR